VVRDLLDVERLQPVMREDPAEGHERVIAEVLVIDIVELVLLQQVQHMVEFERRDAGRLQQLGESGDEVVQVRHVGDDVVGRHQIGRVPFRPQLPRRLPPEEQHLHRDAQLAPGGSDVGRRLDAEHRHALRQEPAQQIAVVRGDLDDLAVRAELEALGHLVGVEPAVIQHRLDIRREVRILGEDRFAALEFLQLHQEAVAADVGMEREEGLHPIQLFRLADRVRHRRHAEVRDRVFQLRAAEAAFRVGRGRGGQIDCGGCRHARGYCHRGLLFFHDGGGCGHGSTVALG